MNRTTNNNRPAPSITRHGVQQAKDKGWTSQDVWKAMTDPDVTYPSRRAGQVRRIRGNLVVIVDEAANRCITVYENVVETALRPDQIEAMS